MLVFAQLEVGVEESSAQGLYLEGRCPLVRLFSRFLVRPIVFKGLDDVVAEVVNVGCHANKNEI